MRVVERVGDLGRQRDRFVERDALAALSRTRNDSPSTNGMT